MSRMITVSCVCALTILLFVLGARAATMRIISPEVVRQAVGSTVVRVPCTVEVDGGVFSEEPHVQWFRADTFDKDSADYKLVLSDYWLRQYHYESAVCRSVPDTTYDCSMTIDPFKQNLASLYKCEVTNPEKGSDEVKDQEVTVVADIPPKDSGDCINSIFPEWCVVPEAADIQATYIGNNTATLTWRMIDPRHKVRNCSDAVDRFCNGTRRWRVRLLSFPNVHDAPYDYTPYAGDTTAEWILLEEENVLSFDFEVTSVKYYQFEVRSQRTDVTEIPERKRDEYQSPVLSNTNSSAVYFFGEQRRAHLLTQDATVNIFEGQDYTIRCIAEGKPTPYVLVSVTVASNDEGVQNDASDSSSSTTGSFTIHEAKQNDAAVFICSATNFLVRPAVEGRTRFRDFREITINVHPKEEDEKCTYYAGSECAASLKGDVRIFVNETLESALVAQAANTTRTLSTLIADPRPREEKCLQFATALACHALFPYCSGGSTPSPRPTCYSSCRVFTEGECAGVVSQQEHPELYSLIVSNCEIQPKEGGAAPECIPVPLPEERDVPIRSSGYCVVGNGRGYQGDIFKTRSGAQCQSWSSMVPHPHPLTAQEFPDELEGAEFHCRNPGGLGSQPWCYTSNDSLRWEYCDIPECACERYEGQFCSDIPGFGKTPIHVDRGRVSEGQTKLERDILGAYYQLSREGLSPGCDYTLKVILCHSTMPFCDSKGEGYAQKLCSDHCALMNDTELCPGMKEALQGFLLSSGYPLPACTGQVEGQCLPVPDRLRSRGPQTTSCYTGVGQTYSGMLSVTESGAECQSWASDSPHQHHFKQDLFKELAGAENYCRNPGQMGKRPWCFTTNASLTWDYCDLPVCASSSPVPSSVSTVPPSPSPEPSGDKMQSVVIAIVVTFIALTLVVVFIGSCAIYCYCKKFKKRVSRNRIPESPALAQLTSGSGEMKLVYNPQYVMHTTLSNKVTEIIAGFTQIEKSKIKYVKQLGQGNFGVVFQGRAKLLVEGEEETTVAVKTLKEDASSEGLDNFVHEAKLMFSFDHPNIIKILGVCMRDLPYYMVFEYMDKGDLTKFLRANASSQDRRYMNPFGIRSRTESTLSNDPPSLAVSELLDICKQVASGMEYLEEKKHVHRDLACRNLLVKSDVKGITVKIGDFGMSHNLYSKDYYRVNGQAVLPVRWMSPEAVVYGKFSTAGDVWSFGVVMWEVFTFAKQPYFGISNEQVTEAIRRGRILQKPMDCPMKVYEIMKECWDMQQSSRPTFAELHGMLKNLRMSDSSLERSSSFGMLSDAGSDVSSDAFFDENSVDGVDAL